MCPRPHPSGTKLKPINERPNAFEKSPNLQTKLMRSPNWLIEGRAPAPDLQLL